MVKLFLQISAGGEVSASSPVNQQIERPGGPHQRPVNRAPHSEGCCSLAFARQKEEKRLFATKSSIGSRVATILGWSKIAKPGPTPSFLPVLRYYGFQSAFFWLCQRTAGAEPSGRKPSLSFLEQSQAAEGDCVAANIKVMS